MGHFFICNAIPVSLAPQGSWYLSWSNQEGIRLVSFDLSNRDYIVEDSRIAALGAFFHVDPMCGYVYSIQDGNPDYLHAEITGYALSYMTMVPGEYDSVAPAIAESLMSIQSEDGLFPHSIRNFHTFPDRKGEFHHFDAGICCSALFDYSQRYGCERAFLAGRRAAEYLALKILDSESLTALIDRHQSAKRQGWWSSDDGCYLGKLVIPLLKYEMYDAATVLKDRLIATQLDYGAWNASPSCDRVHSHGMLYAMEGLFAWTEFADDRTGKDCLYKAVDYMSEQVNRSSVGIAEWLGERTVNFRSDSQWQLIRIRKLLGIPTGSVDEILIECLSNLERGVYRWGHSTNEPNRLVSWSTIFSLSTEKIDEIGSDGLI